MLNVNVKYVSNKGMKLLRGIRFIIRALFLSSGFNGIIFIHYFEKCQIIKQLLPQKKMILDIRTLSVNKNQKDRYKYNIQLKKELKFPIKRFLENFF